MRKAGLKRGSRKRNQQQGKDQDAKNSDTVATATSNDGSSNGTNGENGRKPTSEEAALTAKNYRLAKELSDLRVRHRDETKNVTRLTMENMNLASRCREAISHVAMLKKELAMHQRRSAEALAMQRQQNKVPVSVSDDSDHSAELSSPRRMPSSTNVAMEMDRMDRIMAEHAPPPPPPRKGKGDSEDSAENGDFFADFESNSDSTNSTPEKNESSEQTNGTPKTKIGIEQQVSPSNASVASEKSESSALSGMSGVSGLTAAGTSEPRPFDDPMPASGPNRASPSLFPVSASPQVKSKRQNYNDSFPDDITPASIHHQRRLPAVSDISEQETDTEPVVSSAREEANKKLSSIDAFEASFATTFPESFSSPKEDSPKEETATSSTSQIYNPFFSSPARPPKAATSEPVSAAERTGRDPTAKSTNWTANGTHSTRERSPVTTSVRERSPVTRSVRERSPVTTGLRGRSPVISARKTSSETPTSEKDGDRPARSFDRFSNRSPSPHNTTPTTRSAERYRTPPNATSSPETAVSADQPKRPEKAVSMTARARYERALHHRGPFGGKEKDIDDASASSIDSVGEKQLTGRGPSLVLKRLQQRRERERAAASGDASSVSSQSSISSLSSLQRARSLNTISGSGVSESSPYFGRTSRPATSEREAHALPSDEEDHVPRRRNYARVGSERSGSASSARRASPTSDVPSNKLSAESMSDEMKSLDAMAATTSQKSTAAARYIESLSKPRRSVQEPVSYAEPSLKSKLRQGDVYFPKSADENGSQETARRNSNRELVSAVTKV